MLWIAFRIVFLLMIPNLRRRRRFTIIVVNCFQNCIFTYDSQHMQKGGVYDLCCELLSELYFYLWFPTTDIYWYWHIELWIAFRIVFLLMIPNKRYWHILTYWLWIAFRIVFLLMIPNDLITVKAMLIVVNCFQNCIFTYDSQHYEDRR